jgi:hypothetical protein
VRWPEIALRLMLIVGLFVAIWYGAGVWLVAPLGLLSLGATAELAIRPYAADAADRLLLSCGAAVATLILAGLALNLTPWGLTQTSWAVTSAILSIGVLAWRRNLGTSLGISARSIRTFGPWIFAASLIFVVAGMLALNGVRHWNQKPVLAIGLVSASPRSLVVEVDSRATNARYRIVATSKAPGAHRYSSAPLTVRSGVKGGDILQRIPINIKGIWIINLESVDTHITSRWLRVDVR